MSENTKRQMIVTMLAEGNPVWYVAAMVNMRSHDVYVIGCAAGYPDKVKLRRPSGPSGNSTAKPLRCRSMDPARLALG